MRRMLLALALIGAACSKSESQPAPVAEPVVESISDAAAALVNNRVTLDWPVPSRFESLTTIERPGERMQSRWVTSVDRDPDSGQLLLREVELEYLEHSGKRVTRSRKAGRERLARLIPRMPPMAISADGRHAELRDLDGFIDLLIADRERLLRAKKMQMDPIGKAAARKKFLQPQGRARFQALIDGGWGSWVGLWLDPALPAPGQTAVTDHPARGRLTFRNEGEVGDGLIKLGVQRAQVLKGAEVDGALAAQLDTLAMQGVFPPRLELAQVRVTGDTWIITDPKTLMMRRLHQEDRLVVTLEDGSEKRWQESTDSEFSWSVPEPPGELE